MGWGWGSLLRSDSLARCEKQKDKRLWTDYSRLDIMHHLRYDGTYRLSWSWVKVLMSVRWCPVCCRDMFHKDLSTATESAAILSTAREMMYFTKTNLKRSYFRFASPPTPKVHDMTTSNNSPPPGPKGWNCPCGCPRGSNKSNWTVHQWHFRKSEASFPWLVQTVCLLLAVVFGSYWNFRPWRNSQPQELVMGLCHDQTGTRYNVCVIIENCWRK